MSRTFSTRWFTLAPAAAFVVDIGHPLGPAATVRPGPGGSVSREGPPTYQAPGDAPAAPCMARQIRSGVAGVSRWRTPRWARASTTALYTAGMDPMVPDSPTPFAPSALAKVGVSIGTSSND